MEIAYTIATIAILFAAWGTITKLFNLVGDGLDGSVSIISDTARGSTHIGRTIGSRLTNGVDTYARYVDGHLAETRADIKDTYGDVQNITITELDDMFTAEAK